MRSPSSRLVNAQLGYHLPRNVRLSLDVFNLLDASASDYFYTSRLTGEPAQGSADIHTHPTQPRTARATLSFGF